MKVNWTGIQLGTFMSMFVYAIQGYMEENKTLYTKSGAVCVPEVQSRAESGVMVVGTSFLAPKCRQHWRVFWLQDAAANLHYINIRHIRVEMEKDS